MNNIVSFPSNVGKIPSEIDHHGKNIAREITTMHGIIDSQGSDINKNMNQNGENIRREMELMRESFEREMKSLQTKTTKVCMVVVAINILSRAVFR